ncbi:hypothetical protein CXB51_009622 [Gossypium anomalum]|uniref:Uncharacterized protein n=1 Tax=Gossypium anomalum TaxID=47600 RepID=A0A8J5YLF8_9ROSI|nr:hypothetical protein CXB51_009622 [Gossypium anomalum]
MQGFRCVEIESDSAAAVPIILDESAAKQSISLDRQWKIRHIVRKANAFGLSRLLNPPAALSILWKDGTRTVGDRLHDSITSSNLLPLQYPLIMVLQVTILGAQPFSIINCKTLLALSISFCKQ